MKIRNLRNVLMMMGCFLFLAACNKDSKPTFQIQKDNIFQYQIFDARLGDGVPVGVDISLRWKVESPQLFFGQYESKDTFQKFVLFPRSIELVRNTAHHFGSVDSIFNSQQEEFIDSIRERLLVNLPDEGISVKEVIVTNIVFPTTYTKAMEEKGLRQQELERIDQQSLIALANAKAQEKKAKADAEVEMARATAQKRIEKIKAETEETRRKTELAKAETQAQIDRKNGQVIADKKRMMVQVDLEKQRDIDRQKIHQKRELDKVELERTLDIASVYQNNPTYATFLVNKELAAQVDIAIIPSGTDANVFGNFLKQTTID